MTRLGDHVDSCLGKMLDAKKNKGTPQPYLGNSNVRWGNFDLVDLAEMRFEPHEEERYGLAHGDLVVCEGGEPGRCAIWTASIPGMKIQKALHRIRPKATLNNYYLFYWFQYAARAGLLDPYFTGTTIKHLTGKAIAQLEIPLPPVETQVAMAGILKSLDDRIALLRETNVTLEAIAQAIFKSWFVDFDPVRAKAGGSEPAGLDPDTAALFPDAFEESDLGLVPRGWKTVAVSEVAGIVKGKSYSSKDLVDSHTTALVTLKSFERGGGFRLDGFKPFTGTYKAAQVVKPGELIVAYTDVTQAAELIGKPATVVGIAEFDTLVASLDVGIVRPFDAGASSQFLYGLFQTEDFQAHTFAHTSGTTVLHLAKDAVGSFRFTCPPMPVVDAFTVTVEALAARRQSNVDSMRTLVSLRDTLLPRLISGQVRIPEAEEILETV
nr:restriction endonuclease subunit S [Cupriavidus campinensis]